MCKEHQAFNGRIVPFCANCYLEWLKKRNYKNFEEFRKYMRRNLIHIGKPLYYAIKDVLERKTFRSQKR